MVLPDKPLKTAFAAAFHESIRPDELHRFSRPIHDGKEFHVTRNKEIFRREGRQTDSFSASALFLLRNSKVMLVDMARASAVRWRPQGYPDLYEEHRRSFSLHVPSVSFEVSPDRALLYEAVATGGQLARVSSDIVLRCLDELLPSLSALARDAGEHASDVAEGWFESGLQVGGFASDSERVARAIAWLGDAPMIPQHNDLHLENVVLSDGQPLCIDFDGIGVRPAWQAALILCLDSIRCHPEMTLQVESRLLRFFDETNSAETPKDWRTLTAVAWEVSRQQPLLASDTHWGRVREWALGGTV